MKTIKLFTILFFAVSLFSSHLEGKTSKPNIIYIMADDLGYGDVGFNGQTKINTPNIDQLAEEGMIFTNHYAGSTVCGPSRAVLMTGKHTGHSSIRGNPKWTKSGNPVDLSLADVTVAEEMKRAGYTTGMVGKWGLAETLGDGAPNKQGFDFFCGFNRHGKAHHYYPDSIWFNDEYRELKGNVIAEKKGKYAHNLFTEETIKFIKENKKRPFFFYAAYTIPHYELTIAEKEKAYYYAQDWPLREMKPAHYYHDRDGFVTYAAMVTKLDSDVGLILKTLKDLGIDDNTLVIFTSDNGHEFDRANDEFFNSNGDFRGKKRDLYEGGIHVPFAARWPSKIEAGTKTSHISTFWDFLPTMCDIAGVEPSDDIDGISYVPTLLGENDKQKEHDYLYWEFNEKQGPVQAVRKDNWKAVKFKKKALQLYDLSKDISEEDNVATQYPEKATEMLNLINSARTEHPDFPLVAKKKSKK
jgi:arylsulfatase A-like enzyme